MPSWSRTPVRSGGCPCPPPPSLALPDRTPLRGHDHRRPGVRAARPGRAHRRRGVPVPAVAGRVRPARRLGRGRDPLVCALVVLAGRDEPAHRHRTPPGRARPATNLPSIGEAFAAGQISYSKVRAITRITGTDTATLTRIAAAIAADPALRRHRGGRPGDRRAGAAQPGPARHRQPRRDRRARGPPPPHPAGRDRGPPLAVLALGRGRLAGGARPVHPGRRAPPSIAAVEALVPPRDPVRHPVPASPDGPGRTCPSNRQPGPAGGPGGGPPRGRPAGPGPRRRRH